MFHLTNLGALFAGVFSRSVSIHVCPKMGILLHWYHQDVGNTDAFAVRHGSDLLTFASQHEINRLNGI